MGGEGERSEAWVPRVSEATEGGLRPPESLRAAWGGGGRACPAAWVPGSDADPPLPRATGEEGQEGPARQEIGEHLTPGP